MQTNIIKAIKVSETKNILLLIEDLKDLKKYSLSEKEIDYIRMQKELNNKDFIAINHLNNWILVKFIKKEKEPYLIAEEYRKFGDKILGLINENKIDSINIIDSNGKNSNIALSIAEGMALGNYEFLKYKTEDKDKQNSLKTVSILSDKINIKEIEEVNIIIDATLRARTLVNEPVCYLNAKMLAEEIEKMHKETSVKVEVMNKTKIEALKMGGLLAVNKGSVDPPTFIFLEWKPQKAINAQPIIFVGKGIVFDTGGMNIKQGKNMEEMKCDMSGAAAVASAIYAIAKLNLKVWVIGLIPATDNRPSGNAYVPGDIIKMHNGKTVEVLNTDAEGRLILADALSYAQKYKPELVIDIATLTGAAHAAIGKYGIVAMGAKSDKEMEQLKQSGNNVYERIVEFPFWEEYDELVKSNIADIKNIGGAYAGAISAGKFLQHFVDYPWIHLDIAGPCFNDSKDSYRGNAGTGVGVRLFVDFIKNKEKNKK